MTNTKMLWLLSGPLLVAGAASANAGVISISNPSFEILPASGLNQHCPGQDYPGCSYSVGAIPYWNATGSGGSGQFQSGAQAGNDTYLNSTPDGDVVAYSNGATLWQTVSGVTVVPGLTYTLQVELGFRKDVGDPGGIGLEFAKNDGTGSVTVTGKGTPAKPGDWATYTASYTAGVNDAGKLITVLLSSGGTQADWDNVMLTSSVGPVTGSNPIPEPWSPAILGVGLSALGIAVRRRPA